MSVLKNSRKRYSLRSASTESAAAHIKPDLVLIYARPDPATLRLVRLGSHSELFG